MSPSKQEGDSWGRFCGRDPWRSLTLLHLYFRWSQEGPVFLLFLSFCVCLEVSPAVHAAISTLLKKFSATPFLLWFLLELQSLPPLVASFHGCLCLLIYSSAESFMVCLYVACLNSSGSSSSTFVGLPSLFNCFFRSFTVCSTASFPA